MMGRHHIITSSAIKFAAWSMARQFLSDSTLPYSYQTIHDFFYAGPVLINTDVSEYIWMLILNTAFLIGVLLPDIDTKNSLLGRYIHLPFRHRAVMHSWIPVCILVILSIRFFWMRYVLFGFLLHLLEDSFSTEGIRFFTGIYRTQHFSELVIMTLIVFLCIYIGILEFRSVGGIGKVTDFVKALEIYVVAQ